MRSSSSALRRSHVSCIARFSLLSSHMTRTPGNPRGSPRAVTLVATSRTGPRPRLWPPRPPRPRSFLFQFPRGIAELAEPRDALAPPHDYPYTRSLAQRSAWRGLGAWNPEVLLFPKGTLARLRVYSFHPWAKNAPSRARLVLLRRRCGWDACRSRAPAGLAARTLSLRPHPLLRVLLLLLLVFEHVITTTVPVVALHSRAAGWCGARARPWRHCRQAGRLGGR